MTPTHLGDDILNAWIDGVATDDERSIVEAHLATCETCAERLDELRLVKALLGDLGDVATPRSFRLTPGQAMKPTPIRPQGRSASIVRLLPVVRALSVTAILAVLVLGGALALRPAPGTVDDTASGTMSFGMMPPAETGEPAGSLEDETDAPALARGEVVDQGEAALAHDSTADAISAEAQEPLAPVGENGLSGLEIATITVGVLAIVFALTWMGLTLSVRSGVRR